MSNLMKELKLEVARLARKEVKKELAAVKKINASQRGLIAELRRQVNAIQRDLNGLKKAVPSHKKIILEKKEPQGRFWITGKGVKAMRKRAGLTQVKFSELIGVSAGGCGDAGERHPKGLQKEGQKGLTRKSGVTRNPLDSQRFSWS